MTLASRAVGVSRRWGAIAALVGGLALGGCETLWDGDDDAPGRPAEAVSCPLYGVMQGTGDLVRHEGGTPLPEDMVVHARVTDIGAECSLDRSGDQALVGMTVEITANRGPALRGDTTDVEYFVAIADPSDRIIARDTFLITLDFGGTPGQARQIDELDLAVPLTRPASLGDYRIYVGFEGASPS